MPEFHELTEDDFPLAVGGSPALCRTRNGEGVAVAVEQRCRWRDEGWMRLQTRHSGTCWVLTDAGRSSLRVRMKTTKTLEEWAGDSDAYDKLLEHAQWLRGNDIHEGADTIEDLAESLWAALHPGWAAGQTGDP